jgi:alpha-beta hydrolase superfamily lysophospholipase
VTITYGTDSTDDHFPVPVQDIACALGLAAERVPDVPLVLLGHSAGAQLAALTALAPELGGDGGPGCTTPPRPADAVVGLAGPYDVAATGGVAAALFGVGPATDPDLWAEGNPLTWAADRPEVAFLLVHGDADRVVGTRFTTALADALVEAGHPTTVEILPGVGHNDLIGPEVVADLVTSWVDGTVVPAFGTDEP